MKVKPKPKSAPQTKTKTKAKAKAKAKTATKAKANSKSKSNSKSKLDNTHTQQQTNGLPPPKRRSGYQLYISESVKGGTSLSDAAKAWKAMSNEQQDDFKNRAAAFG